MLVTPSREPFQAHSIRRPRFMEGYLATRVLRLTAWLLADPQAGNGDADAEYDVRAPAYFVPIGRERSPSRQALDLELAFVGLKLRHVERAETLQGVEEIRAPARKLLTKVSLLNAILKPIMGHRQSEHMNQNTPIISGELG